jgi:hypothetical protein
MLRFVRVWLLLAVPFLSLAADDSRPACSSKNQGRMWPEAANHDPKLISRLVRCGELLICVRGSWHYHWESPSVRIDQLGHGAKTKPTKIAGCEVQPLAENESDHPAPSGSN